MWLDRARHGPLSVVVSDQPIGAAAAASQRFRPCSCQAGPAGPCSQNTCTTLWTTAMSAQTQGIHAQRINHGSAKAPSIEPSGSRRRTSRLAGKDEGASRTQEKTSHTSDEAVATSGGTGHAERHAVGGDPWRCDRYHAWPRGFSHVPAVAARPSSRPDPSSAKPCFSPRCANARPQRRRIGVAGRGPSP